jgi:hypothetical protein
VNLSLAEAGVLPLAAALLDTDGTVIAATPEWRGAGPGTVVYAMRSASLAVATAPAEAAAQRLLDLLLASLGDAAGAADTRRRGLVSMLATSLRVVAGRQVSGSGTSHQVLDLAVAGIRARTGLEVSVDGRPAGPVRAPEVVALCLVQLAVNAERHTRTTRVVLTPEASAFHVSWPGETGSIEESTARRHGDRRGWGLGFCRIAADTLGAALHPPIGSGTGVVTATLELGLRDLALPLAMVRAQHVVKATRAWDEETGCLPGARAEPGSRLGACLEAAARDPGSVVSRAGWSARQAGERTWVAIPPDDVMDRARDVISGMAHERALWEGVPEPHLTRVVALAALLGQRLGTPLPRVPAAAWNREMATLARALGLRTPVPSFAGLGAVDPRVAAYLAAEVGEEILAEEDDLFLRPRPGMADDPRLAGLSRRGALVRL